MGHREEWSQTFDRLLQNQVSVFVAAMWRVQFEWWTDKARERIAADPLWIWPPPRYGGS